MLITIVRLTFIKYYSITEEDHPLNDVIFQRSGGSYADLKKTLQFPERDTSLSMKNSHLLSQNGNMRQDGSSTLQKFVLSLELQMFICVMAYTMFLIVH